MFYFCEEHGRAQPAHVLGGYVLITLPVLHYKKIVSQVLALKTLIPVFNSLIIYIDLSISASIHSVQWHLPVKIKDQSTPSLASNVCSMLTQFGIPCVLAHFSVIVVISSLSHIISYPLWM